MTGVQGGVQAGVQELASVRLIAAEPERLAAFYQAAFGFVRAAQPSIDGSSFAKLIAVAGARARVVALRLGDQGIELIGVDPAGRSVPPVPGWSPLFQHCALVVADMAAAYRRLATQAGWSAISTAGPQQLPAASGGVTAFKFRDPEGHPLELLAFAPDAVPARWQARSGGPVLGIDHSAISIADTARSVAFYASLGLQGAGGSYNLGPAQDRLDGVPDAHVEVTALAPRLRPTPHVELLCYRGGFDRSGPPPRLNDGAATELVFAVADDAALQAIVAQNPAACIGGPALGNDGRARALLRDPDGHLLCLESR